VATPADEIRAVTEIARDVALRQLDHAFQASDNLDTKAVGVLTLDIAALAAILAGIKDVFTGRAWEYPAGLVLLSAILTMAAIATRRWSYGPDVGAFCAVETADVSKIRAATANADLISELIDKKKGAIAKAEGRLKWKAGFFMAAMGLVVVAGLVSAIILK
jgi:hypothetical protein